jgi:hypothetical protein
MSEPDRGPGGANNPRGGAVYSERVNAEEDVQHLREAAAARVEATSLRGTAREIGMSPTWLTKFLLGAAPYSVTLRRLRKWYLQYGATPSVGITLQDARVALAVLTNDLTPATRRVISDCLLDCLGRGYDISNRPRPGWVTDRHGQPGGPERLDR